MRNRICELSLAMLLPVLGTLGCGGSVGITGAAAPGGMADPAPTDEPPMNSSGDLAALTIHLVDGPIDGAKAVNVEIQTVELIDDQGASTEIAAPNRVINLLELQGGISDTLAAVQVAPGSYQGLRLVLGTNNWVHLADDTVQPLTTPSAQQSGLQVAISITANAGDDQALFVDFDVAASIRMQAAGLGNKYLLRPVLRAVNAVASGVITGRLSDAASGIPLSGAAVFAETRDASGQPSIVRHVLSAADGSYRLDMLPLGASYFVVTEPAVNSVVYGAKVSGELTLNPDAASATFDAQLSAAASTGSLQVQVSPMATDAQSDTCMLMQGDPGRSIIIASEVASLDSAETAQWNQLPSGSYTVQCVRRTSEASGNDTSAISQPAAAALGSAATTVTLSF